MRLYFDCRCFRSETNFTKVYIFDGDTLIDEKYLRRMSVGLIEVSVPTSKSLRLHFEFIQENPLNESDYILWTDGTELEYMMSDYNTVLSNDEERDEDCLDEAVFIPNRWIFAYDTLISFCDEVPEMMWLSFNDDYIEKEIIVCVPLDTKCQVLFTRNISEEELKETKEEKIKQMILKIIAALGVGFVIFQLMGALISVLFSGTYEHKSSFYFILLVFVILPVMFLIGELRNILSVYKSIREMTVMEYMIGGIKDVD